LTCVFRADLTDSFGASFTVPNWVAESGEGSFAELTELYVLLSLRFYSFDVEGWWERVCLVDELGILLAAKAGVQA